jgi:hypothetical protein
VKTPSCPFHVECLFNNTIEKTAGDELLSQLFCCNRYETCDIAIRLLDGKPVPAGACPDGNVKG